MISIDFHCKFSPCWNWVRMEFRPNEISIGNPLIVIFRASLNVNGTIEWANEQMTRTQNIQCSITNNSARNKWRQSELNGIISCANKRKIRLLTLLLLSFVSVLFSMLFVDLNVVHMCKRTCRRILSLETFTTNVTKQDYPLDSFNRSKYIIAKSNYRPTVIQFTKR